MSRRLNENEVTVLVTGPHEVTTAIMHKIKELLEDQTDIPVTFADPKQARDAENDDGDWDYSIELYKPSVVLAEEVE